MPKPPWLPSFASPSYPRSILAFVAVALFATGCGAGDAKHPGSDSEQTVVVTMDIWADIVGNVACGTTEGDRLLTIDTLIPPGADPHRFEASLRDRTELERASFIVANGLSLEASLESTIESAENDGTPVLRIGDELDLHHDDPDHDDPDHDEHEHSGTDPHIWLDPVLVSEALPIIAEHLVIHAGLDEDQVATCVADYQHKLTDLDQEIRGLLENLPSERRNLVTNHDSLSYFAGRYDLTVIGTVIPSSSSLAETSPATLERLAELITRTNTPAIFSETQHSDHDAVALGQRLGVEVVPLATSSLGPAGSESATYLGWLQELATLISEALLP